MNLDTTLDPDSILNLMTFATAGVIGIGVLFAMWGIWVAVMPAPERFRRALSIVAAGGLFILVGVGVLWWMGAGDPFGVQAAG